MDSASSQLITQNAIFSYKNRWDLLLISPIQFIRGWRMEPSTKISYTSYPISGFLASQLSSVLILHEYFYLPGQIIAKLTFQ